MSIPGFTTAGLLPRGVHVADLDEVELALVPAGSSVRRRAAFHGVASWALHAGALFGAGTLWLGGGFVSMSEPGDTAIVVYLPDDLALAAKALDGGGLDLLSLMDVQYSYPGTGGAMRERWPVSALVDAYIADRVTVRTYQRMLGMVVAPDGISVSDAKGFVQVEVGR